MSQTIRPAQVAGNKEPHAGCAHTWRSIGAHVIHLGSRRVPYRLRSSTKLWSIDRQEVREVFICDYSSDLDPRKCTEVLVKIHYQKCYRTKPRGRLPTRRGP